MEDQKSEALEKKSRPIKCNKKIAIEGWILYACNIDPEAQEEDINDLFADYGKIKNIHLNLDRRTGTNKGYALIEFSSRESAEEAIKNLNSQNFMGKALKVDFALKSPE